MGHTNVEVTLTHTKVKRKTRKRRRRSPPPRTPRWPPLSASLGPPERSFAQAAGCCCRPRGAGVQQNISKSVWARFRSVRQSLRPTRPEDPLVRRISAGQLSSAPLMSSFLGARGQLFSAYAQRPSLSGPHFGPAEPGICSRGAGGGVGRGEKVAAATGVLSASRVWPRRKFQLKPSILN